MLHISKLKLLVNLDSLFLFLFLKREKLNELISNWRKKTRLCAPNFGAQTQYIINPYSTISKESLSFKGSHYLYKTNNLARQSNTIKYYNTYIKIFLNSTNEFSQRSNQI